MFYREGLLAPRPTTKLEDHPLSASATAYSTYSKLPSISEAVTLSATWGRAMPWWQEPTTLHNKGTPVEWSAFCWFLIPNYTSVEGHDLGNFLPFQFSFGHFTQDVSFLFGNIHFPLKHCCATQHFYVADSDVLNLQHPQNALLCFHCNSGYENPPRCYVTRTWRILFLLFTTHRVALCCCDSGESCNKCNLQKGCYVRNKSYRLLDSSYRSKHRCTVSRADDKIAEACFTPLMYIGREIAV